ncbi:putative nitrate reductase, gamma subunit [Aeropyrum pernix K1]|uniref:Nitrate reductase, gamma subunit n=1 Tax=Aeropyrum pernix (strain ATCC 700893 / DSM 11879 / JCM 9820 / NBRC 100138 / K1) TaxID=272557 RepID=Q9YCG0_AERPE|nr:ethylbenzene dehydrogenase-related protein [Aeropyrum pernix]BAA80288.1 putative nitrate reductase, gamma subunit [Aeropyrum pernix K1]
MATVAGRGLAVLALLALAALIAGVAGFAVVTAQVPGINAVYVDGAIPLDPTDSFWQQMEKAEISLVSQNIVYPMTGYEDVRTLRVAAAVSSEGILAIYLEWEDPTMDVPQPGGIDEYPDKVAVQFPLSSDSLPYICMGTAEQPVSIVLWSASGSTETLIAGSAYGMSPEHREALGLHSVPTSPIELVPPEAQVWGSNAVYKDGKWMVVLYRPTGSIHELVPTLEPGSETSVAFAVWQGSKAEVGGKKSTSAWFTMRLGMPEAAPGETVTVTETQPGETVYETVTETMTRGGLGLALAGFIVGVIIYTVAVAAYIYLVRPRR